MTVLIKPKEKEPCLYFSEYLRQCREESELTQEDLAGLLYQYDSDSFASVDTNTISRWERGTSIPRLSRQVSILKYFQKETGYALPCLQNHKVEEIEKMICETGMSNLLGKSKKLILNFPSLSMGSEDLKIVQLRNSDIFDEVSQLHMELDKSLAHKYEGLGLSHFKSWVLHSANSFFLAQYKNQFFGMLFTLRLKPQSFEKIMNLQIREKDLGNDDFASFDEQGCNYIISFFAMNEKVASMLFIRYFAHLISHQKVISEVGMSIIIDDAKKLPGKMNFRHYKSKDFGNGMKIDTYRETLPNFLASEYVLKMILSKRDNLPE